MSLSPTTNPSSLMHAIGHIDLKRTFTDPEYFKCTERGQVNKMSLDRGGERPQSRSPSYSPVITRRGIADTPFSIPRGYKTLERTDGIDLAGSLDLSQYHSSKAKCTDDSSLSACRGDITFSLSYSNTSERLRVDITHLGDVSTPSTLVTGAKWTFTPSYVMVLLPERRRLSSGNWKNRKDNSKKLRYEVGVKRHDVCDKTLRISIFDKHFKNDNTPVGHVLFPLKDAKIIDDTLNVTRPLALYSQPSGFNKGKIALSVMWVSSAQKLEISIGRAHMLKSPRGILGRDFFARLVVYIGGDEYRTQKSAAVKACTDVEFDEKFVIPMTSKQLQRCSLVFTVFAKHIVKLTSTSEEIGSACIGPFMGATDRRTQTQWERLITTPFEEISEDHTLYL